MYPQRFRGWNLYHWIITSVVKEPLRGTKILPLWVWLEIFSLLSFYFSAQYPKRYRKSSRSTLAVSTASLCPHCQRPSQSLWSWCKGGSSTPMTAPLWCVGWRSAQLRTSSCKSLPDCHGAFCPLPLSSSLSVHDFSRHPALSKGSWKLVFCYQSHWHRSIIARIPSYH